MITGVKSKIFLSHASPKNEGDPWELKSYCGS
jgi:hypothetical protein